MERAKAAVHPSLAAFARLLSSPIEGSGGKELLVVAAHPDDETAGLGSQFQALRHVTVAHVTDGAPMASLARRLAWLFAARQIRFVCTHPFEGGHPDHDATAFAVDAACRLMRREGRIAPQIIEFACYHAGPDDPVFQNFAAEPAAPSLEILLDEKALAAKRRMLARHATQRRTLAPFMASVERFRAAPDYDFRKPPNGGRPL
ncbi:PIG-L deacetylase family protein, partial [Allomesorhizobium alhagi]